MTALDSSHACFLVLANCSQQGRQVWCQLQKQDMALLLLLLLKRCSTFNIMNALQLLEQH